MSCMVMFCVENLTKNRTNKTNHCEAAIKIYSGMTEAEYLANMVFYIENIEGFRTFERYVAAGYNFYGREVHLRTDLDLEYGYTSFKYFSGIFNGNEHTLYRLTTDGLFYCLDYGGLTTDNLTDSSCRFKDNIETVGLKSYLCVLKNLYLLDVKLPYNNNTDGDVSPFIQWIRLSSLSSHNILIKNCGVRGIQLEEGEKHRNGTSIAGIVAGVVVDDVNSCIMIKDCYIDSRVGVYNSKYDEYKLLDPMEYICGPFKINKYGGAFNLIIQGCYCVNNSNTDIKWTDYGITTVDQSYQYDSDVPSDHPIHKATSQGNRKLSLWYKHEKFNGGYAIPRALTRWTSISFCASEYGVSFSRTEIQIPDVGGTIHDNDYIDYWYDFANKAYSIQGGTFNVLGQSITVTSPKYIMITSSTWTFESPVKCVVTCSGSNNFVKLRVYQNSKVSVSAQIGSGEIKHLHSPSDSSAAETYFVPKGAYLNLSVEDCNGRTQTINKTYGTNIKQTLTVNLITKLTCTVPCYSSTGTSLGEVKIVFESYLSEYVLCNAYRDETTYCSGWRVFDIANRNKKIEKDLSVGLSTVLKSYNVVIQ